MSAPSALQAHKLNAEKLIKLSFKTKFFRPRAGPLFASWTKGKSNAVVLVGDNATGKSFYRRIIQALCARRCHPRVECIHLSMEGRTSRLSIFSSMIYGDESYCATGYNSGHVVQAAIKTASGRKKPNMIFFDEPDTGLSDEYAMGAAKEICAATASMPLTKAIFVVTHRRPMVEVLLRAEPHVLIFGKERPANIQEWLERKPEPRSLKELEERGRAMFKALMPLLKEK